MRPLLLLAAMAATGCTAQGANDFFDGLSAGYSGATASPAMQSESNEACLRYTTTNKAYRVNVDILTGQELNKLTSSFNYQYGSKYVIAFWGPEQASVIRMDMMAGDSLPTLPLRGEDQQGREWTVQKAGYYCN